MQHISVLVHLIVTELILRKQTWTVESNENLLIIFFFLFLGRYRTKDSGHLQGENPERKGN